VRSTILKYILAVLVASLISTITLWVLWPASADDPKRFDFAFVLFVYAVIVIVSIFAFFESDFIFPKLKNVLRLDSSRLLGIFFVLMSLILFIGQIFSVPENYIILLAALAMTSFGSGYSLLNLVGYKQHFSKLEFLVLSFLTSFLVTGLVFFAEIYFPILSGYLSCVFFLVLTATSLIKSEKSTKTNLIPSLCQPKDILLILLAVGFYVIFYIFLFSSRYASSYYTDSSDFYRLSLTFPRWPSMFYATHYVLFVLYQSSFLSLSHASLDPSQIALGFLPIMLIPAVYILVKKYAGHVDSRLPGLSTILWVLFASGLFGWVYFIQAKSVYHNTLSALEHVGESTYYSTMSGIVGYTFVGFTVSFIAFIFALFLLKNLEISRRKFFLLLSSVVIIMFLSHVSEAVVFAILLALWGIISRRKSSLRINDAIYASLIAFCLIIVFLLVSSVKIHVSFTFPDLVSILLPTVLLFATIILRKTGIIFSSLNKIQIALVKNERIKRAIPALFIFGYVVAFLVCTISIVSPGTISNIAFGSEKNPLTPEVEPFTISQLAGVWFVPWYFYPLLLGFNGLLAIISVFFLWKQKEFLNFKFFIVFLIFSLVFGRALTFINQNFFATGYWESRFIYFMAIAVAALAPIPLLKVFSYLKNKKPMTRTLIAISLIGLIVTAGAATTFLNVEYWSLRSQSNQPTSFEMDALNQYRTMFILDPHAASATITGQTQDETILSAPTELLSVKDQVVLGSATSPESVLRLLGIPPLSHFYLFMHNRDFEALLKINDTNNIVQVSDGKFVIVGNTSSLSGGGQNAWLVKTYDNGAMQWNQTFGETGYNAGNDLILTSDGGYAVCGYTNSSGAGGNDGWLIKTDADGNMQWNKTYGGTGNEEFRRIVRTLDGGYAISNVTTSNVNRNDTLWVIKTDSYGNQQWNKTFEGVGNDIGAMLRQLTDAGYLVLGNTNGNGYLYTHLIPMLPIVFSNQEVSIYNVSRISYPLSSADQILVLPQNSSEPINQNLLFSYDLLSQGFYKYTNASEADNGIMGAKRLILSFDPNESNNTGRPIADYMNYVTSGGTLIVLNSNGLGSFGKLLFASSSKQILPQYVASSQENLSLPNGISVPTLELRDKNQKILSNFTSGVDNSPFIIEANLGKGQLFYVNIAPITPITSYINNNDSQKQLIYKITDKLLNVIGLEKYDLSPIYSTNGLAAENSTSISTGTNVSTGSSYNDLASIVLALIITPILLVIIAAGVFLKRFVNKHKKT
jgi:hypothetical protein